MPRCRTHSGTYTHMTQFMTVIHCKRFWMNTEKRVARERWPKRAPLRERIKQERAIKIFIRKERKRVKTHANPHARCIVCWYGNRDVAPPIIAVCIYEMWDVSCLRFGWFFVHQNGIVSRWSITYKNSSECFKIRVWGACLVKSFLLCIFLIHNWHLERQFLPKQIFKKNLINFHHNKN